MISEWNLDGLAYERPNEPPYLDYMPVEPPYDHYSLK